MYTTVKLHAERDTVRLQDLLQRCSDFYELHEGCATPPDAGSYELTAVPPRSSADDLCVLALQDDDGSLCAAAQLLRDYPERGTWWIGMLVVTPALRSRGIGALLFRRALEEASANGATRLGVAVSLNNPRARRFWEREGFEDSGRTASVSSRSGHVDAVRILSRAVVRG